MKAAFRLRVGIGMEDSAFTVLDHFGKNGWQVVSQSVTLE